MSMHEEIVKVFKLWVSPYANRVLIALEELGVPYETQEEDMDNKSRDLLEANPIYKQVPVMIHNGKPLPQSLIILEYIHDTWCASSSAATTLLPTDPYEKAIARFWADFIDDKFWKAGWRTVTSKGEAQEEAKKEFVESFLLIEEALQKISGGKPYFGGDKFGYLDIVFVPYTCMWPGAEIIGDIKIPYDRCPHLSAWIQLVSQRDSVKKILPAQEVVLEYFEMKRKQALSTSN
uniref:Glutathione-dependent dehydroascorbate reductase n=1 Tax=Araucaria cunninghamii TaxID=56994 RepID=A0A0D6QSL5_ARACU